MPNYYDPNTFARVDPTRVRTVAGGTQWDSGDMLPDQYWTGDQTADDQGYMRANSGTLVNQGNNIDAWGAAQGFNGGGGFGTATSKYLNDLNAQYGLDVNDFSQALTDYNTRNATPGGSAQWWEDQAQGRAFADSLGRIDPRYSAGWTNDAGLEATQQNRIGGVLQNVQANSSNFGDELKTLGMLAGVAAGGVGLAGLAGVGGGAAALGGISDAGMLANALGSGGAGNLGLAGLGSAGEAVLGAGELAGLGGDGFASLGSEALTGGLNPGLTAGGDLLATGTQSIEGLQAAEAAAANAGTTGMSATEIAQAASRASTVAQAAGGTGTGAAATGAAATGAAGAAGAGMSAADAATLGDMTGAEGITQGTQNWAQSLLSQGASAIASAASALGMTPAAFTSLLGKLAGGALDAYAASQRNEQNQANADRAWNAGAPYRNMLLDSYANPSTYLNSPEARAIQDRRQRELERFVSARDGNPAGSGRALTELSDRAQETMLGQLGNYRQQLANFGNQSQIAGNWGGLAGMSANDTGVIGSLGATARQLFAPEQTAGNILRSMGINTPLP